VEGELQLPLDQEALGVFADAIRRLPPGDLSAENVTSDDLRLFGTWDLAAYYAPFDHLEINARVVLVATAPPLSQAITAHRAARDALWSGLRREEAWHRAALAARPSGTYRTNLVHMLDGLGLAEAFGVPTMRQELDGSSSRIHFTYCVRYPVLVNDLDYSGRRPKLLRYPPLRRFVDEVLARELAEIPDAIVIPVGRVAGEAVATLIEGGRVELARCLLGVPNPSGANGHREEDYERTRDELRLQLAAWFRDHADADAIHADAG
jgi:hypothetical protein